MEILVGTCGFSGRGGRKNYTQHFNVVEVQETFYRIVPQETLSRWRKDVPAEFEFTLKAFQGVTHPAGSPTWRRAGSFKPSEGHGFFKPTPEVMESWEYSKKAAQVLGSKVVVFQTPPSFGPSEENIENMNSFFSRIDRGELLLGWEPRGAWYTRPEELELVLTRNRLVHIVDPFRHAPLSRTDVYYFRLHGIGSGEVNYSYKYSDEDLVKLREIIETLSGRRVYVMFNNVYMFEDALRFKQILARS